MTNKGFHPEGISFQIVILRSAATKDPGVDPSSLKGEILFCAKDDKNRILFPPVELHDLQYKVHRLLHG